MTTTTQTTSETPKWTDHPFVKRASTIAAEAGEPCAARVLEELLNIMHDVEDRFPGVPFDEILADRAQMDGKVAARVRTTLRRNGACEADIDLVCPRGDSLEVERRKAALRCDPYAQDERL